jgi:hypothetical protein
VPADGRPHPGLLIATRAPRFSYDSGP